MTDQELLLQYLMAQEQEPKKGSGRLMSNVMNLLTGGSKMQLNPEFLAGQSSATPYKSVGRLQEVLGNNPSNYLNNKYAIAKAMLDRAKASGDTSEQKAKEKKDAEYAEEGQMLRKAMINGNMPSDPSMLAWAAENPAEFAKFYSKTAPSIGSVARSRQEAEESYATKPDWATTAKEKAETEIAKIAAGGAEALEFLKDLKQNAKTKEYKTTANERRAKTEAMLNTDEEELAIAQKAQQQAREMADMKFTTAKKQFGEAEEAEGKGFKGFGEDLYKKYTYGEDNKLVPAAEQQFAPRYVSPKDQYMGQILSQMPGMMPNTGPSTAMPTAPQAPKEPLFRRVTDPQTGKVYYMPAQ